MRATGVLIFLVSCGFAPAANHDGGDSGSNGSGSNGSGNGVCATIGQRVCIDATHSGSCDSSLQAVTDRSCPPSSLCSNGYCAPAIGATPCNSGVQCSGGKVCDLFVVAGVLAGSCMPPFGAGGTYSSCSPAGNAPECKTGLCADAGGEHQCLVPCVASCAGGMCSTVDQPTTVEGVSTAGQKSCTMD